MIDPRIPDDGRMSQVKRITPEYFFPKSSPTTLLHHGAWMEERWYLQEEFPSALGGLWHAPGR